MGEGEAAESDDDFAAQPGGTQEVGPGGKTPRPVPNLDDLIYQAIMATARVNSRAFLKGL